MSNLDNNYLVSGIVDESTQFFYKSKPVNSIIEFYLDNEFIMYDKADKKFKLIYKFPKQIILNRCYNKENISNIKDIQLNLSTNNLKIYNLRKFFILIGYCIFYSFILWNIYLFLHIYINKDFGNIIKFNLS
jgi:hypothetical protein